MTQEMIKKLNELSKLYNELDQIVSQLEEHVHKQDVVKKIGSHDRIPEVVVAFALITNPVWKKFILEHAQIVEADDEHVKSALFSIIEEEASKLPQDLVEKARDKAEEILDIEDEIMEIALILDAEV